MSGLGVHFAIGQDLATRLLAADDEDVETAIDGLRQAPAGADQCGTDRTWDAIHRSLTDGRLVYGNGAYPLNAVILGGRQVYDGDYIVSLLTPDQVRDAAGALSQVSVEQLRAGYEAIDPADYDGEHGAEDFEFTWKNFSDVVAFFQRAAQGGGHVVFTVDA